MQAKIKGWEERCAFGGSGFTAEDRCEIDSVKGEPYRKVVALDSSAWSSRFELNACLRPRCHSFPLENLPPILFQDIRHVLSANAFSALQDFIEGSMTIEWCMRSYLHVTRAALSCSNMLQLYPGVNFWTNIMRTD